MRYFLAFIVMIFAASASGATPASQTSIANGQQFDALARTVSVGRHARFPQVMFVIDRGAPGAPTLYFVNTRRYAFHIDFVRARSLSVQGVDHLLATSYSNPNRRFIFGTIVRYPALDRYGVEFWEGDQLDAPLLTLAMATLSANFYQALAFKPNSQSQIDLLDDMPALASIDTFSVYGSSAARVLNEGQAVGRLRILTRVTADTVVARNDILIVDEVPVQLSPVAGLITTHFSTPLSHVNLLAKSWRIPNAHVADAAQQHAALDGQMVSLRTTGDQVQLRAATPGEIARAADMMRRSSVRLARADLNFRALPTLREQRARDASRTGAKAANLGEVARLLARRSQDFDVPAGFSIPFAYYADFLRTARLDTTIDELLAETALRSDPVALRHRLGNLRAAFAAASLDPGLLRLIRERRAEVIGPGGVFVRSSTNSEDLKGFNGAGLYTSVPNVTDDAALATAIKTVWASVWNDAAFAAREAAGIDHRSVMASVLIQRGMNADASGVMITENPFDPDERGCVFINAKRGLGIRVVEGRRIAEQLLYRPDPESVQVLTRTNDDAMLTFDARGGVREVPSPPNRAVLTDDVARRLARIGSLVARSFGDRAQDIEWLIIGDAIYIVQTRPYLRGQ